MRNVEVMGRDVSIVSENTASLNPTVRSIVDADNKVDATAQEVRFTLKPHKTFLFNKETEERIGFEIKSVKEETTATKKVSKATKSKTAK